MVRGTVNGGGVWFWARRDLWLRGERTAKEGMGTGFWGTLGRGRSREWTKKKKLTDTLRFFVTKGRDDYFLFWVSFFPFSFTHYGFTVGFIFIFFLCLIFLSLCLFIVFFLSSFAHLLVAIKCWTVFRERGVVGGCRVLGTPGGWFLCALNKRDQRGNFFILGVC